MSDPQIDPNPNVAKSKSTVNAPRPLRVWPGVVLVALQWLLWFVVPRRRSATPPCTRCSAESSARLLSSCGGCSSAARPGLERIGAIVLMVVAVIATKRIVHPSIAGGMMGMMLPVFSIPFLCLALVAAAAVGRRRLELDRGAR